MNARIHTRPGQRTAYDPIDALLSIVPYAQNADRLQTLDNERERETLRVIGARALDCGLDDLHALISDVINAPDYALVAKRDALICALDDYSPVTLAYIGADKIS